MTDQEANSATVLFQVPALTVTRRVDLNLQQVVYDLRWLHYRLDSEPTDQTQRAAVAGTATFRIANYAYKQQTRPHEFVVAKLLQTLELVELTSTPEQLSEGLQGLPEAYRTPWALTRALMTAIQELSK